MRLIKYDGISDKSVKAILSSGGGSSSNDSDGGTRAGSSITLDRTIWGQNDTGDDVDGSMTVNGNISIKCIIPPTYEDDDSDDGEDEELEEGGGNLDVELKITSKEIESSVIYGKSLYMDYPKSGDKKQNVADLIKANADQISINEANIEFNEIAIKNNADDIVELKKKTAETAQAVSNLMPIGSIIMFNGQAEEIPANWHICDGTEGTPNLIDKFIKASDKAGNTGGSDSITLATNNIPKLLARIDTDNLSNLDRYDKYMPLLDEVEEYVFDKGGATHYCLYTGYNAGDRGLISQKYRYMMADVANNTVVGYDNPTAIDIQPSYYSLIYIMKIK